MRDSTNEFKEEQKSWLRSLVGVFAENLVIEVTRATCGTLARARRVVAVPRAQAGFCMVVLKREQNRNAYADSDWATHETERNSSPSVVIGQSALETSSTTQSVISLSSGEAALHAATRAAACGIQLQQLLEEICCSLSLRVQSDSAADPGVRTRLESGWVKHRNMKALRYQGAIVKERFRYIGTKLSTDRIVHLLRLLSNGRSMSFAGFPWSRTKTNDQRGRGGQSVPPRSSHSAVDARAPEEFRTQNQVEMAIRDVGKTAWTHE